MKYLLAILLGMALSGCGLQKSVDQTNDQVKSTNDQLSQLVKITAELKKEIEGVRLLNEKLNAAIATTNESAHLNVIVVALEQLLSPVSTDFIEIPYRMIMYAKVFGDKASEEEIIATFDLLFSDAQSGYKQNQTKFTESSLRIQNRLVSLQAANLIAALTSQTKLQNILASQVSKGVYKGAAFAFAYCRFATIRDLLFNRVLTTKFLTKDLLENTVGYAKMMRFLWAQPFRAELKIVLPRILVKERDGSGVATSFDDLKGEASLESIVEKEQIAADLFARKLSPEELADPQVKQWLSELKSGKYAVKPQSVVASTPNPMPSGSKSDQP